ncbi:Aste57867_11778 [Aphanomyces stellatus]|uniref:Aste57867_11778 protein n=1 Tax=Aphanomyces stellatus TaxID=120398 RepID=A0A485KTY0_9STRA|nr:hypothetical protein As57867_011733 [Aphanomyces stellatus]VFT88634.1 Aste57867_11778 [Aphanomyces stellatus]
MAEVADVTNAAILRTDGVASKYEVAADYIGGGGDSPGKDPGAVFPTTDNGPAIHEHDEDEAADDMEDMPEMDLAPDKPVKLKFKRQHTFQQRQRRHIKKQVKFIAASSHSAYQFLVALWRACRAIHVHEAIAYALIVLGIFSECTTPAPRYNVPIGTVLMTMSIKKIDIKLVTSGLLCAIVSDIIWLCRHDETSYGATFSYTFLSLSRLFVACCLCLKAWLTISIYWYLEPHEMGSRYPTVATARALRRLIFQKIGYFFPTTNLPPAEDLSRHTLLRLVALLWIHVLSGVVLLLLGLVSCVAYTMYPQFQDASLGIPLHYMLLVKGGSTVTMLLLFSSHLHPPMWRVLHLIVSLQGFRGPLIHWHGVGYGQDSNWIKTIQFAKTLDMFAGCYLFLVLYSAFHHGSGFYQGVMAVLSISTFFAVLLECWTPLLGMVVYKFVGVMEQAHRDMDTFKLLPRNWNANDTIADDANASSSSSSDTSDGSSSSSSSESCSDSSTGRSSRETKTNERSGEWLRYYDTYNRPYIRNSLTGETFWDRPPDAAPVPPNDTFTPPVDSPLSNTIYMTADDFKYFWNSLPHTGGFLCRIVVMPTVEILTDHLSECRFYVITDGLASEHIRAVYFYAIHTTSLAHFLGAFLMDSLTMQLEAKFKCDQVEMVPTIVQCLQLRHILGEFEPMEEYPM